MTVSANDNEGEDGGDDEKPGIGGRGTRNGGDDAGDDCGGAGGMEGGSGCFCSSMAIATDIEAKSINMRYMRVIDMMVKAGSDWTEKRYGHR